MCILDYILFAAIIVSCIVIGFVVMHEKAKQKERLGETIIIVQ